LSFSEEKLEIICFSLRSKFFKNMVLEKIKSGEGIASLHTHQEGVPGPFAGGEEIPLGFLTGRQVKREIDLFGAFPS
jgi:hypothetical protein